MDKAKLLRILGGRLYAQGNMLFVPATLSFPFMEALLITGCISSCTHIVRPVETTLERQWLATEATSILSMHGYSDDEMLQIPEAHLVMADLGRYWAHRKITNLPIDPEIIFWRGDGGAVMLGLSPDDEAMLVLSSGGEFTHWSFKYPSVDILVGFAPSEHFQVCLPIDL